MDPMAAAGRGVEPPFWGRTERLLRIASSLHCLTFSTKGCAMLHMRCRGGPVVVIRLQAWKEEAGRFACVSTLQHCR